MCEGPARGSSSTPDLLHWLGTANLTAALQNATHHVKVLTTASSLTIFIDGVQVLSQAVTMPSNAYLGFTGGTGGATNRHAIAHLTVTSP